MIFGEIRTGADWLFFKMLKLNKRKGPSKFSLATNKTVKSTTNKNEFEEVIEKYQRHIQSFCDLNFNEKDTNKKNKINKDDPFIFINYFWQFQRFSNFATYMEENLSNIYLNQNLVLNLGKIYFMQIFNLMRMIKFYKIYLKDKNLSFVNLNNKEIPVSKIEVEFCPFFGKPPNYVYKDINNPLNRNEIFFNEEIYLKAFLFEHNLSLDNMIKDLKEKYIPNAFNFYLKFKNRTLLNDNNNNVTNKIKKLNGINFYLNLLKIITTTVAEQDKNINKSPMINDYLLEIFKVMSEFDYLYKFPKVYKNFLNKYTES